EIGVELAGVLTVGDHHDRLVWAWRRALELADVVISTGGIGPTADDLTSEVVAEVVGVPLVEDAEQAARIRQLFAALGREMPANNLKQALLPRGAIVIPNALGTAPGYRLAYGAKHLVVLPGVPREMKPMMEETVLLWLARLRGGHRGLLAHRLTSVPGSAGYVRRALVAYANSAKQELLGVRRETLAADGAVSEETAGEMAAGARRAFDASIGVSTTGIAGPDGGTPEKPVGTVCFGLAAEAGVVTRRYQLWGTRGWVKLLASQVALAW